METGKKQGILVIGEIQKQKVSPVTFELLYAADCLKNEIKTEVSVVLMGNDMEEEARQLCHYPAGEVLYLENPSFRWVNTDICMQVLRPVLEEKQPAIILIGATAFGRVLGAALAWQLQTELITDASRIWYHQELDRIVVTRPAFDGKMMADYSVLHKPMVVSVRQGMMKKVPYTKNINGQFIKIKSDWIHGQDNQIQWLQDILKSGNHKNLTEASIIVSGGRGLKGKEGFQLLEELAERLGAQVGSTRPCVDAGWTEPAQQVGQSGIAVKPKLYMAFGISGAIQHMTAIEAETMIAVNNNPKAAIFQYCDYGIVGDARQILRTMIEKIDAEKGRCLI